MGFIPRPLHFVHLHSKIVSSVFPIAAYPQIGKAGHTATMLMGNHIAGGKVDHVLKALDTVPGLCEPTVMQP